MPSELPRSGRLVSLRENCLFSVACPSILVESTRRLSPLRISHPCAAISWATHVRKIRCEDEADNDKETEETTQGSAGIRNNGSQIEKGGLVLHSIGSG